MHVIIYGLLGVLLTPLMNVYAEVYRYVDENGQVHFSDSTSRHYESGGYKSPQGTIDSVDLVNQQALENTANRLKNERLGRESKRKALSKKREQAHKKQQQKIRMAKKQKEACRLARKKEDQAFRQRGKSKNVKQMGKALANYEKKRDQRKIQCR